MADKKAEKEKVLEESNKIEELISAISSKKYALANKYLTDIINDKLQNKISLSLDQPLF